MGLKHEEILFVEDDENDVFFYKRALAMAAVSVKATFVRSFAEACTVLLSQISNGRKPRLIITDLKLIGEDGFQVIAWVKRQPALSAIPVWVFTSSALESDREKCNRLGAAGYVVKIPRIRELSEFFVENFKPLLNRQTASGGLERTIALGAKGN